jgi:hypothetical protein
VSRPTLKVVEENMHDDARALRCVLFVQVELPISHFYVTCRGYAGMGQSFLCDQGISR